MQFVTKVNEDNYIIRSEAEVETDFVGGVLFFVGMIAFCQVACWIAGVDSGFAEALFGPLTPVEPVSYLTPEPDTSSESWAGRCRVRSGPGTEFEVIGSTSPSKAYVVLETDGGWKRIGPRGWVGCH